MTMEANHSPLPWNEVDGYVFDAQGAFAILSRFGFEHNSDPEIRANAEFLVRAVNAHGHLLSACKTAANLCESLFAGGDVGPTDAAAVLGELRRAIAKANARHDSDPRMVRSPAEGDDRNRLNAAAAELLAAAEYCAEFSEPTISNTLRKRLLGAIAKARPLSRSEQRIVNSGI